MEHPKRKFKWDSDDSDDEVLVVKRTDPKVKNVKKFLANQTLPSSTVTSHQRSSLTRSSTIKRSSRESLTESASSTSVTTVPSDVKKRRDAKTKIRFESCINEQSDCGEDSLKLPACSLKTVPGLVVIPIDTSTGDHGKVYQHRTRSCSQKKSKNSSVQRQIKLESRTVTLTGEEEEWIKKQVKKYDSNEADFDV